MKAIPFTLVLSGLLLLSSCNSPTAPTASNNATTSTTPTVATKTSPVFVQNLEAAHQKVIFTSYAAVQFHLILSFGGRELYNGTLSLASHSGEGLLENQDGEKIYFSGDKVYVSPDNEQFARSRSAAYTWPYFFMLPYKANDPGTQWSAYPNTELNGRNYLTQQLEFAQDTGDSADDWYILYADTTQHLLQVAAYIATGGQSTRAEAEQDPHAIEYLDYSIIEGMPIATHWKFWAWRKSEGLTQQLGEATLSNITFLKEAGDLFAPPTGFKLAHK